MEYTTEIARYENGCLSRDNEQLLAVAVLQRLDLIVETEDE